uniref:FANCI_HD2 domain-containing protein n=1 Tax=Caenorhabditis japonica TaxID=281687 RepID=A0A8R1HUL6_CAEJA
METMIMSQAFTQATQPRRGGGTEKFVDALIKFQSKHPDNLDGVSETSKKAVISNLRILGNDSKWQPLGRLLIQMCSEDRGRRLFEFTHSIFGLCPLLPDGVEIEHLLLKTIKFLIDVLIKADVSVPDFFGMYNDLIVQLENVSNDGFLRLVEHISEQLEDKKQNEDEFDNGQENVENENRTVAGKTDKSTENNLNFNQRWRDFVTVLIKKIRDVKEIEYELEIQSGSEAVDKILFHWLQICDNVDAFELLAEIANSLGSTSPSIDRFCDEIIAEEIGVDMSSTDISAEKRRRTCLTWKSVILTTKTDKDRMGRLWNGVVSAWEIGEEEEREKQEKREVSENLNKCLQVGKKVLSGNVESAKRFLGVIRNEKYRILSSEFGLALALVQCGLDRNDALADMKKTLQKLFRIKEQAEECVWMNEIVCGRLSRLVDLQLRILTEHFQSNDQLRRILTRPVFSLMLSLLDTPAYQKQVVVVDGKVVDGCSLWLLSRDILSIISQSQIDMASQLSLLFQAIASASNNSSALILIDVLRELVRKCSVEILNNSKLIDGLFDYVCRMRRDIAVSLIRCLLPIINTRPQLRNALFKSLKKDLLCESTVCSAVPIVLMLLRSVSKRREDGGGGQFDHSFSQSFGSFSTQTLNSMGCKKNVDQEVGLELIGIVRRCLWQPATTKIALYDGICDLATQTTTMLNQFLDMMVSHAKVVPEWKKDEMIVMSGSITQLVEPMPHLIQTVECLISELTCFDPEFKLDGTQLLLKQATTQMETWVALAMRRDVCDFGLDRNVEWTTGTSNGRSSLLFAQMMLSTYDVLIEHMWRRVEALEKKEDADKLVILLNRRKEIDKLYKEKTTKKEKDGKDKEKEEKIQLDTSQTEILTSSKTLASIMKTLTEEVTEEDDNNTSLKLRTEILLDVRMELIEWAVSRAEVLSRSIVKEYKPLHSILSGTNSLISLSKSLIDFYIGTNCPAWVNDIETGTPLKTKAIESYCNIIQHLAIKYKQTPSRVTMMWFEEKEGEDEETRKKRQEPNILALRQAHFLSCRLFRQILNIENEDIEDEKKPKTHYEQQGKEILKAATAVLSLTKNVKVWTSLFARVAKVLEEETFYNNQMLRDYCKFVTVCGLRCGGGEDKSTSAEMLKIMEGILEFLSEEQEDGEELKYHFISRHTLNIAIEFQFTYVEKTLSLIREALVFQKNFFVKPPVFDEMLNGLLVKCIEVTELISRVLQIFVQYKMMQERVTEIMTNYFSTIQMAVVLLQNLTKGWGREMKEWESVSTLATLVKKKLTPILAMVDDHIGFSKGKEEMKKKISQKTRYAKSKRDEKLFSQFSQEREAVQHSILVLCKLIKDDRFDLQIKNNSVGYRDFRIDMDVIRSKLGEAGASENIQEPTSKRRRREQSAVGSDGTVEDTTISRSSAEPQNEDEEEEEEEARAAEPSVSAVKQENVEEDEEEEERGISPVF